MNSQKMQFSNEFWSTYVYALCKCIYTEYLPRSFRTARKIWGLFTFFSLAIFFYYRLGEGGVFKESSWKQIRHLTLLVWWKTTLSQNLTLFDVVTKKIVLQDTY